MEPIAIVMWKIDLRDWELMKILFRKRDWIVRTLGNTNIGDDFMDTTRKQFINYLVGLRKYKSSTIDNYAQAIEILTRQLHKYLPNRNYGSLYNLQDVEHLVIIYMEWSDILEIQEQENRQNFRYSNAFKRYIEFCENLKKNHKEDTVVSKIFDDYIESKTEGGEKVITSHIAERDSELREKAIQLHGLNCSVCGFNFSKIYGELGNGFIEIHHITKLRQDEVFNTVLTNPLTDLKPVCSNCHRMIHKKKNITLSIDELKTIIGT